MAELDAESVAYAVCYSLGFDSGDYSFGYDATWASGGTRAVSAIKAAVARIQRTANEILNRLDARQGGCR